MPKTVDKMADHIAKAYRDAGYSEEDAREAAWAILTQRGLVRRQDGHEAATEKFKELEKKRQEDHP